MLKQTGIRVNLIGEDGNALVILGRVCQALRRAKQSEEFVQEFMKEAMSGSYSHLITTVSSVVEIVGPLRV